MSRQLLWRKEARSRLRLASFVLLFPVLVNANAAAQQPERPNFVAHVREGKDPSGILQKLSADWSVTLGGADPTTIQAGELITLRRLDRALPSFPRKTVVVLTNGDWLVFAAEPAPRIADDRLHLSGTSIRPASGPELTIPVSAVAVLWLLPVDDLQDTFAAVRRLLRESRAAERIHLRNNDTLDGSVEALDQESGFRLRIGKRTLHVPLDRVASVAFNTGLLSPLRPKGSYAHLVMADGSRLAFSSLQLSPDGKELEGKLLFGAKVRVPLNEVISLDVRQGAAVYLSELKPKAYQHTPYLGAPWPLARDANVVGRELRLKGSIYDKGLGIHAESQVTYKLTSAYCRFEALVGLDDETGKRGRVRVQVLVDGKAQDLGWDKELTAKDEPLRVNVNVRRAKELTLVVRYGSFGPVQAQVNWAEARLIR
jgi:hypothetical protein